MGMVVAIGLVVDDAIVVVEAVERHIEEGMAPHEAAIAEGKVTRRSRRKPNWQMPRFHARRMPINCANA